MPIYRIGEDLVFPHPSLAEPDGLLGVGGDLCQRRLLLAYANGIFPWYSDEQPILWFSPDPRMVLQPRELHVPRSLRKRMKQDGLTIRMDTAFRQVMQRCRTVPRRGQAGTWITEEMLAAYQALHEAGFAHSVEAWRGDELVGGLYGVAIGHIFSGESMFSLETDASKTAFTWAVRQLAVWGYELIDCQIHTEHLARFGAKEISRESYLEGLGTLVHRPGRMGRWDFDPGFHPLGLG